MILQPFHADGVLIYYIKLAGQVEKMDGKVFEYKSLIYKTGETGGAYVVFPYDIRKEFGRGRVKIHATFDGEPYDGRRISEAKGPLINLKVPPVWAWQE